MKAKISIITVVYNAGRFLESTLKSVKNQSYPNIEYIVIDGGSTDNTLDLIDKYNPLITKCISEPDEGLYSAMNKGLKLATGTHLMFLNAGDIFNNDDVLSSIFRSGENLSDIYYGETIIINQEGVELGMRRLKAPEKLTWKSLKDGMLVCHQSFIVKRELSQEYNLKYKIAADFDWMLSCLKKAKSIENTHMVISKFMDGGINKQNISKALFERFQIMIKNYNFFLVLLNHFVIGYRFTVSYIKNGRF
jgi:glycosyltransferase involved in cell wall biosynthesis